MAKIFTSYKYEDTGVFPLYNKIGNTARDYVDYLQPLLEKAGHTNKGEVDGEDLSGLSEEYIESLLFDRLYDSSITIVLISKNMKEPNTSEKDQWIPREVSYSLRESTRDERTSHTNAVVAVVIPDENGSYEYFVQNSNCPYCNTITWRTDQLFEVLRKNMFNRKQPKKMRCTSSVCGREPHTGNDHSYIHPVKWDNFISDVNTYINIATEINENIDDYNLEKAI